MQKFTLLTLLGLLLSIGSLKAGVLATKDSASTADSLAAIPKLTFSGYIDVYYLHAFNNPQSGTLMGNPGYNGGFPVGRAFDRLTDQFALGLVQTKFNYSSSKFEIVADLTFGPNAELGNFGNSRYATLWMPKNTYVNQLYNSSAAIKQAYGTWKATKKLSITAGQFGTHIGYEVIDAPINYHYSLSNLFNNGPFYHIGAKANYAFNDNLGLMVGLVNNWDNLTDNNKQKSGIAQLYIKPVKGWNVYLNWIGGYGDDTYLSTVAQNDSTKAPLTKYNRNLFDLTTGYQITKKFYLGLNAAYGMYSFKTSNAADKAVVEGFFAQPTTKPNWWGVAGYANYQIKDFLGIGVRYEHFSDKYYVRYIGATNNSLTITMPITLANGNVIVKPEFRMDTSPSKIYEDKNGQGTNRQTTIGTAVIFKY